MWRKKAFFKVIPTGLGMYSITCSRPRIHEFTNLKCCVKARSSSFQNPFLIVYYFLFIHCKPLQGNYRVELVHREIPVVITGNEFTEYSFLLFWLHFFPCFNNIEIVALVPVICTGNCQFILQGFKGCFNTL